jgi:folate-binding Fe-S cluster repair protein YgfZ
MQRARLGRYGLLSVTGDDARDFLHAQLTNDIQGLAPTAPPSPAGARRRDGCSPASS